MTAARPPVLITRAEPGNRQTALRLTALGATVIPTPVLTLQANPDAILPDLSSFDGLVFTSANGVRFFSDASTERSLPAWCVGPATAEAAQAAGFTEVRESAGDAVALAGFIRANAQPRSRRLLHVANAAAKGDLKRELEGAGFDIIFCPLYKAANAASLTIEAQRALKSRQPAIVLVHSAKGAEAFARLAEPFDPQGLTGVAISQAAAVPLQSLNLKSVHIAAEPNESAIITAFTDALATLSA